MKIFLCQTGPLIADFEKNLDDILKLYHEAIKKNAEICIFPELCVSGYMARDLFLNSDFISRTLEINNIIIKQSRETLLILPSLIFENDKLYNGVYFAQNGEIIGQSTKVHLPNYGVFDEKRYFAMGRAELIEFNGHKIAAPICEDIWYDDVCKNLAKLGADLFIVPNGSPYYHGKLDVRFEIAENRFNENNIPIIYCNQVMAQDGIIFDGNSFLLDSEGVKLVGPSFEQDNIIINFDGKKLISDNIYPSKKDKYADIAQASIMATRDYVHNNGFNRVIIGISGGIDSAIVAYLAVKAVGAENVLGYILLTRYTSAESLDDAFTLARTLNFSLKNINIDNIFESFIKELGSDLKIGSIAYQNLQSRIRGTILMAESNIHSALLLTTGNKSEFATGYCTIYGDMNGAFNPIKDLYKTEVYELARYINRDGEIIANNIIIKEPSAELASGQIDSDSLPEYKLLDEFLFCYLELSMTKKQLISKFGASITENILNLIKLSEFKRNQSPPGARVSKYSFDLDRRVPITFKKF